MKPKTLKPWSFVKDLRYDISVLDNKYNSQNPEDYYYQLDSRSNIYTPAVRVIDLESIPERIWRKE